MRENPMDLFIYFLFLLYPNLIMALIYLAEGNKIWGQFPKHYDFLESNRLIKSWKDPKDDHCFCTTDEETEKSTEVYT
jgi:hypothetical protein